MGLLIQSDSTTLEQAMQRENEQGNTPGRAKGTRERRIQEQMLICGIGPVAGLLLNNDRCLEFQRHLQNTLMATCHPAPSQANGGIV